MNLKPLILLPFLLACSSNPERTATADVTAPTLELKTEEPSEPETNEQPETTRTAPIDWQAYQDSLRAELVKSKSPNFLIGSMLEELYIRNLVSASHRELTFNIPLDLHGFDCGAPDCYSTDLNFSFPHDHQLVFPDELSFNIHEHGCVDSELRTSGTMKLVELGDNFVNYYSTEQQSNLVIIEADERQEYVYYFIEVEENEIKAALINELLDNFPEDDPTEPAPYRSTQLLTKEYEQFLDN